MAVGSAAMSMCMSMSVNERSLQRSESRDVMCTTPLKRDYWEDTCVQHYHNHTINIGMVMRKNEMR
jgi:hypothetical protein